MTERLDLTDALRRYRYDHAVFCTFNFQPEFFEELCLEEFDSISNCANVTIIMDGRELDGLLQGPSSRWPRQGNLRYLLHGARPKSRFHPKVFLFASATRGLLTVGSANLTRPGLTRNAELVRTFPLEVGKDERWLPLFRSAVQFLGEVGRRWPSDELRARLDELAAECPWLESSAPAPAPASFLHNLETPLLPQVSDGQKGADEMLVVSPFFDEKPRLLDWVEKEISPSKLTLFTQNGAPSLSEAWTKHPLLKKPRGRLLFSSWGGDGHAQQLHAKALAFRRGGQVRLVFGSANFTRAALLSTAADGNVEVVLALDDLPTSQVDLGALFDPNGSAREEKLIPGAATETAPLPSFAFRLREARLNEGLLECLCETQQAEPLEAVLRFGLAANDGGNALEESVAMRDGHGHLASELEPDVRAACDAASTVVYLRRRDARAERSNPVLLVNVKDLVTGGSQTRDRRIRQAERSAEQFAAALHDLLLLPDTTALQFFLTFCDIQVSGEWRPRGGGREPLSLADARQALRDAGERNLRAFVSLHEAAIGFSERHIKRLKRQAKKATVSSVPSFMHLVQSVARVLATQVERLLVGLAGISEVNPDDWGQHRDRLDKYLSLWLELLRVATGDWLAKVFKREPSEASVRTAMAIDLAPLREIAKTFLATRERVEAARSGFRVVVLRTGDRVTPPVGNDNLIAPSNWRRWTRDVEDHWSALAG